MISLRTLHELWAPNGTSGQFWDHLLWPKLETEMDWNRGFWLPSILGWHALILVFSSNESISDRSWMFLSNVLDFPNSQSFIVLSFSTSHSLKIGISQSCSSPAGDVQNMTFFQIVSPALEERCWNLLQPCTRCGPGSYVWSPLTSKNPWEFTNFSEVCRFWCLVLAVKRPRDLGGLALEGLSPKIGSSWLELRWLLMETDGNCYPLMCKSWQVTTFSGFRKLVENHGIQIFLVCILQVVLFRFLLYFLLAQDGCKFRVKFISASNQLQP